MANLTFSNHGIPMGRNKSIPVNNHTQWSQDEDNFLIMAAAQNLPVRMITAKLGRSSASVFTRKWQLGIKNDKSVPRPKMAKAPKAPKKKRKSSFVFQPEQTYQTPAGVQLFALESGVPVPARGSRGNEQVKMQIRNTFMKMEIGQSFVINKEVLNSTLYIAKNEFGAYRIKTSATSSEKRFFRIFRVA